MGHKYILFTTYHTMHNAVKAHARPCTRMHAQQQGTLHSKETIQQAVHVSLHLGRRTQRRGIDVYGLKGDKKKKRKPFFSPSFCRLSTGQINNPNVRDTDVVS